MMAGNTIECVTRDKNIDYLVMYNLPQSWKTVDRAKMMLEIDGIVTAALIPTHVLNFKDACHLCLTRCRYIFENDMCIVLSVSHGHNKIALQNKIISMEENVRVESLCQAKYNKELFCPLIVEQQLIFKERECNLMKVVESWFSDVDIFKHKDILVAMDNGGWVPLSLISTKLQDIVYLSADVLIERLSQSNQLIIDSTKKYIRRVCPKLPNTEEFNQILLLDIPDAIKSIKQLPSFLNIDDSIVESFDYGTHSALLSLKSRSNAEAIVEKSLDSLSIKCRLLVPNIIETNNAILPMIDDDNNVHKLLHNLVMKDIDHGEMHVSRFDPTELTYEFPSEFCPPSNDVINKIVTQCNFYFSDANVLKDLFILKKIKSSCGGWIELDIISRFKMMTKLSNDNIDNVVYSMCFSDQVQISRDGKCLRRRLPLPEWDGAIYTRTLFLWRLPQSCQSFESLDKVFKNEGRFAVNISRFIAVNRNIPADLRKLTDKVPALGKESCGVVEFNNRATMLSAHDYIHMRWPSVMTFYLDAKSELPKPAVIVGRTSKFLPPPIPILDTCESPVESIQSGTRIDPRFWQAAQILHAKKREDYKVDAPRIASNKDFPPLIKEKFKDNTNFKNNGNKNDYSKQPFKSVPKKKWNNIHKKCDHQKEIEPNENKDPMN